MRALLLTFTLAAVALAGCTDDSDADTALPALPTQEILARAGDPLGVLELSEPVDLDSTPAQDELCDVGRIGYGTVEWEIPEVDPATGGAWVAQTMTIDVAGAGQSASAGESFVLEVIAPDGSQAEAVAADAGDTATATLQDAEAGVYTIAIHACESAAGLAEEVESTATQQNAYQVDGTADMVATEDVFCSSSASASGSGSASDDGASGSGSGSASAECDAGGASASGSGSADGSGGTA